MILIQKVISGGSNLRKTRLHDEKGNLIDFQGTLYAPKALATTFLRVAFGYRPHLPWISYRAIQEIERLIQKDWKVIEFGSGMSTLWLAKRCGFLHSVEDNEHWYKKVTIILSQQGIENTRYELRSKDAYSDLTEYNEYYFDLALIDGTNRAGCMRAVVNKIKHGGWIYLDNSDKFANEPDSDFRIAETVLLQAVAERSGKARHFVDFAPAQSFVSQGILAKL